MTYPQNQEQPWEWRRCWVARRRSGSVVGTEPRVGVGGVNVLLWSLPMACNAGAPAINTSALTSFLSL